MELENYWIYNNDTIVFKPDFNESINNYINIIKQYDKLIFSNFNDLNKCIENNNLILSYKNR